MLSYNHLDVSCLLASVHEVQAANFVKISIFIYVQELELKKDSDSRKNSSSSYSPLAEHKETVTITFD